MNPNQIKRLFPKASESVLAANSADFGSGQPAEAAPKCGCRACNPAAWWMIACDICGNKRCPHANNHENACTGSNDPGQPGSDTENVSPWPRRAPESTDSTPNSPKGAVTAEKPYDHDKTDHSRQVAELERNPRYAPLAAGEGEEGQTGRIHLRLLVVRKRCLDPDNCAIKWTIDNLRYLGALQDDREEDITLEVSQRKAAPGEAEHTEITIVYP